jgi:hypothetical protein
MNQLPTPTLAGRALRAVFSRKNGIACLLCLILLAVFILSADQTPQWIYQGF